MHQWRSQQAAAPSRTSQQKLTSRLVRSLRADPRLVSSLPAADSQRRPVFMLTPSSDVKLFLLRSKRTSLEQSARSTTCCSRARQVAAA